MRTYEVMFILRPDLPEEESEKLIAGLETAATQGGAQLRHTERMGRRRLAYSVRGFADGTYVRLDLEGDAAPIHELHHRLRVSEPVIKFLVVRTDEIERRFRRDQRRRERRAARKPAAAAVPAAAAPAAGEESGAHSQPAQTGDTR
ncbi:MAG: 30S ribosomal protein S6 [Terriglobales bacterium]